MTTPINGASSLSGQNNAQNPSTPVARQEAQTSAGAEQRQAVAASTTLSGSSAPTQPVQEAPRQSAQELSEATRDISEYIQSVSRSLNISVDGDLGTTVIQVLDAETEELVRQIPAEEILQIARFLSDQQSSSEQADSLRGLLIDQQG